MARTVAIIHRRKKTAKQEARPTLIQINENGRTTDYKMETETDELDFLLGRFPTEFRKVTETDSLTNIHPHHIKWKKVEDVASYPSSLIKQDGKRWFIADKVPSAYDGIRESDTVLSPLGGSGDRFIYAITKRAAKVYRLPPFVMKDRRGSNEKDNDPNLLITLWEMGVDGFREVKPRDLKLIKITEAYSAREEAMKARMACEQRLYQRLVGKIYLSDEGGYPEGRIEDEFDAMKANDVILTNLKKEEAARERELAELVEGFPVYSQILKQLEGCGPMIAARIIVAVGDIRRFKTKAKFKAYCGVHLTSDGQFVRRRKGEVANWPEETRQAFWLLADQFNRRPKSLWGIRLREIKAKFRQTHPEPVARYNKDGKLVYDYTDGHLHKMGRWRVATKFAEWLYREWRKLEKEQAESEKAIA